MRVAFSLALVLGGVLLLWFGVHSSQSLGSEISKFFTGSPTNRAIWMMIGGTIMTSLGLFSIISHGNGQKLA